MPFLLTVVLFCTAALVFPMGFYIDVVGGQRYKLPNNTVVGSSYILFILSIFFTIVGLLFAGKVCLPGWPGRGSSLFVGLDRALEEGSAGLEGLVFLVFFSCKNTKDFRNKSGNQWFSSVHPSLKGCRQRWYHMCEMTYTVKYHRKHEINGPKTEDI